MKTLLSIFYVRKYSSGLDIKLVSRYNIIILGI